MGGDGTEPDRHGLARPDPDGEHDLLGAAVRVLARRALRDPGDQLLDRPQADLPGGEPGGEAGERQQVVGSGVVHPGQHDLVGHGDAERGQIGGGGGDGETVGAQQGGRRLGRAEQVGQQLLALVLGQRRVRAQRGQLGEQRLVMGAQRLLVPGHPVVDAGALRLAPERRYPLMAVGQQMFGEPVADVVVVGGDRVDGAAGEIPVDQHHGDAQVPDLVEDIGIGCALDGIEDDAVDPVLDGLAQRLVLAGQRGVVRGVPGLGHVDGGVGEEQPHPALRGAGLDPAQHLRLVGPLAADDAGDHPGPVCR